jgi:hypothetical protein
MAEAKERYRCARDAFSETRKRMLEDLQFSNPADPKQWDDRVRQARENSPDGARPCLTFDQTNQYIAQVVNDSRQNKPGIQVLPADEMADSEVATSLEGHIRQIEYVSRAGIAYDTAQEYAARIGLGWIRVLPEVTDPATNHQEIRIKRVQDPLSVTLNDGWSEPDGSDATEGWITSTISKAEHEKRWPGKKVVSWDESTMLTKDKVVICEHFEVTEKQENRLVVLTSEGEQRELSEDEYWKLSQESEAPPQILSTFPVTVRSQKWEIMNGDGVLEETEFPSRWVPLIPVLGYELWVEGKRYLCGLTRRMMDGQRAYNYERSAYIEQVALQPKAPYLVAWESIEEFDDEWKTANTRNASYLPYRAHDDQGNQFQQPTRQNPPTIPTAFAQGSQLALNDIQASIGMYRANLGAPSNETSGKAINARQREGDTANFHYIDNLSRSIEHLGRIIVEMIPKVYDTKRSIKTLAENGSHDMVTIDPAMSGTVTKRGKKVMAINPGVGVYDVRVKVGPAYTTLRQESAESLGEILRTNPNLLPILGPMWARMQDWPEADKVSRMLLAMAPPAVQQIEEGNDDIPPEVQAQLMQMKQTIQQLEQAFHKADAAADGKQAEHELEWFKAQTDRLTAEANAMAKTAAVPDFATEIAEVKMMLVDIMRNSGHLEGVEMPPAEPEAPQAPPGEEQMEQQQPADAGFFTPDAGEGMPQ